MLKGRRRAAEPGIVGDIHQQTAPLARIIAGQFGENPLETNQHANLFPIQRQGVDRARRKVANSGHQLVDERKIATQGDIFAKGNQMHLIATAENSAGWIEQKGAVEIALPAMTDLERRAAEQ